MLGWILSYDHNRIFFNQTIIFISTDNLGAKPGFTKILIAIYLWVVYLLISVWYHVIEGMLCIYSITQAKVNTYLNC